MSVSRKSTKKRYTTEEISFNNLTGLHYKPPNSFPDLIPFSIENCSNATLLVLDTLAQCTVDESKNSFIFIGCCDGPIFIRDCHDSTIITASKQLRLKNCHRLNLFIYCSSQPIIELSTEIQFSPFCFYYPELLDQFEKLKMNVFNNFWNPIYDFSDSTGKNWTIGKDKLIEYPTTPQLDILGIQLDQSSSIVPYTFGNLYQNHLNDFKKIYIIFSFLDAKATLLYLNGITVQLLHATYDEMNSNASLFPDKVKEIAQEQKGCHVLLVGRLDDEDLIFNAPDPLIVVCDDQLENIMALASLLFNNKTN